MITDTKTPQQFTGIRQIGSTGLDYLNDSQDIKDTCVADALNVVFDRGYPTPRGGSQLVWAKPTGETNPLNCLFDARASDGTEYAIGVYAPNFYFRDEVNNQWVKINNASITGTVTITLANPAVVSLTNHGLSVGDAITFSTTGVLPSAITAGTVYYVISTGLTANAFEFSASAGGSAINTNGESQSGGQTVTRKSYTPSTTYSSLMYGYTNWNAGIASDVLYCGNGQEDSIRWQIGATTTTADSPIGTTSLVCTDTTKFPATGYIVIQALNNPPIYTYYSSNSSNTLAIPSTTVDIGAGACVTFQIQDAPQVQKGNIFSNFSGRLIIAGQVGGESTVFGSQVGNAENFVVPSTPNGTDPLTQVITDGTGGITGLDNFGTDLIVEKSNGLFDMDIGVTVTSDSTGDSFSYQNISVTPIANDTSMGPVQPWTKIKKNNLLYYLTATEGAIEFDPLFTGVAISILPSIISRPIQPYITGLNFTQSRVATFDQKIFWSAATNAVSDTVLMYDMIRSSVKGRYPVSTPEAETHVWSRFNNWPVKDWLTHNNVLYYGSRIDGGIYQCFTPQKIDGNNPFEAYITTKSYDFGQPALPKTMGKLFVSGYISLNETLYFDMILTTGNQIITTPYYIQGNGNLAVVQLPLALAMAMLGVPTLGMFTVTPTDSTIGIFRGYLAVPSRYGFFTVKLKPHSLVNGTDWGFTGIGFSPWLELKAPEILTVGAIGDPTNQQVPVPITPTTGGNLEWYQATGEWEGYTGEWENT